MSVEITIPSPGSGHGEPAVMLMWPDMTVNAQAADAFQQNGYSRNAGSGANMWGVTSGGAGTMERYRDILCGRLRTIGATPLAERQLNGFRMRPALERTVTLLVERARVLEYMRVWRWSTLFAWETDGGTTNVGNGLCLMSDGLAPSYPSAAGVGLGMGIQGDGAGGWRCFSKPTLGGNFVDFVALPAGLIGAAWALVDMEIQSATPSLSARFRIAVNGTVYYDRTWEPGHQLPPYSVGFLAFRAAVRSNVLGTFTNLYLGPNTVYAGCQTMDGALQLSPFGTRI